MTAAAAGCASWPGSSFPAPSRRSPSPGPRPYRRPGQAAARLEPDARRNAGPWSDPGRILMVEFDGPPGDRDAPITLAELQGSLRRISKMDVTITDPHSATRFTDNARQATEYRIGRVLLAGDAAHVHSPFGGQGLNLGIGDAANLGWKLAAAVHGWAPDGLLDTYTDERHPLGARVLQMTRAQVALMRTDEHVAALREIVSELMDTDAGSGAGRRQHARHPLRRRPGAAARRRGRAGSPRARGGLAGADQRGHREGRATPGARRHVRPPGRLRRLGRGQQVRRQVRQQVRCGRSAGRAPALVRR